MDKNLLKEVVSRHRALVMAPYDQLVTECGLDAVVAFSALFEGTKVYVPNIRTIFKACIEQDILNQPNHNDVRTLAKRYGFSEQHIRTLIKRGEDRRIS